MSSTTTTVSMNARRRSGNRGPTSASSPSANAVSVDIAMPQPCADELAGVEGEVDRDRHRHAADPGEQRQRDRRRSRSSPRSNSRRASRPTTKKKNVISPLFTHSRRSSDTPVPPTDRERRRPRPRRRRRVDVHPASAGERRAEQHRGAARLGAQELPQRRLHVSRPRRPPGELRCLRLDRHQLPTAKLQGADPPSDLLREGMSRMAPW